MPAVGGHFGWGLKEIRLGAFRPLHFNLLGMDELGKPWMNEGKTGFNALPQRDLPEPKTRYELKNRNVTAHEFNKWLKALGAKIDELQARVEKLEQQFKDGK